ncbi:vanadium-dependent haloperoxidase [Larkinella terrae]|uniref:Phosphatase PAP2 family protein n=1 Tax=Larkinella terrae TaxID=2025311 RepID=A0A7K0EGB3_9BACT|nr:vanadium-dependent haloperoxidase [Larkinella terrae]MRS60867.1 phosphatase PAP2 family protein [Larkinella terrae]
MIFISVFFLIELNSCQKKADDDAVTPQSKTADQYSADVALRWSGMQLYLLRNTTGFSPPVASRSLGYAGLALYESVVPGLPSQRTLAGQLNGLTDLPKIDPKIEYYWPASANAAEAQILRQLYANTSDANKAKIDSLEKLTLAEFKKETVSAEVLDRSAVFGKQIADAIFEWSKTDGGHEGYNRNYPADFKVPVFNGSWQTTENGRKIPMQPYWGKNRLFVVGNSTLPLPKPLAVSADVKSQYFAQYLEVYTKNKSLTQTEKEISIWWADDPSETFTPPGHSYNLARITIQTAKADLGKAAETLARTGIAVADGFTICWKLKFAYNNERPYTFVRRTIDPAWIPFWPAPPFPGYSSGHATQSAAAATVLADLYGETFSFTDDSHVSRVRDVKRNTDFKARNFTTFWAAAEESAYSRYLGGIHTRQDNETGLSVGKEIGKNVNNLKWIK